MIDLDKILELHKRSLKDYGGGAGVRDMGGLDSAINRPKASFGGEDLYPTPFEKAAAIGESIIMNHPFVDANKRTGFLAMYATLFDAGYLLDAAPDNVYETVVAIASGQKPFEDIVAWLKENTVAKA